MARICLPVSHLFETETETGRALLESADVLELRNPKIQPFLPDKPLVYHWGYGTVQSAFITAFKREGLDTFLTETGVELFSFDLGPACRKNQFVLPLSRTLSREEILDESARAVEFVREFYSGPLAAENYNYYPTGMYEHVCRPDFMAEALEKLDLGLVLDLAHAEVTAVNLKLDMKQYLGEFPMGRVREIHLSRPFVNPWLAVDAHAAPEDENFDLLAFVLQKSPKDALVAIEYYKDLEKLAVLYQRLNRDLGERKSENMNGG